MSKKKAKLSKSGDLADLRKWLPKAKSKMDTKEKKKDLKTLDQWVAKFDDESWMKLAQQNKTLWNITKTTKAFSDMSWKVAVNAALLTISSASRRDTYVHTLQAKVRLNMWAVTLGFSGISRKTTTRQSVYNHLTELKYLNYIPVAITPQKIYDELRKTPNALILGDELGSFFKDLKKDFMSSMPDILSDIYDCKETMERSTVSGGRITAKNPYLRIYGGGTMSIIKHLSDDLFEQGFIPRFHWVLDFNLKGRKVKRIGRPNPHLEREYEKVGKDLEKIGSLKVKALLYEDIPKEFEDYQDYCVERLFTHTERGDYITAPYYSRLPFHALKIAGLLYLSDLALGDGTNYAANVLPSEYILLGTLFMRLYEQEYLQLIYRYKSSAPAGRFDTQAKKLSHVENLLKLDGGIASKSSLLKSSGLISDNFDPVIKTLKENGTIKEKQISKELLIELKIIKKSGKYPFMGRAPLLVWHREEFKDDFKKALKKWIETMN